MRVLYLVATDEDALNTALEAANITQENYAIDVIGFAEGYVGYMCNLLGDFTDEQLALLPVIPFPAAPLRIFGGWDNGEAPKLIVSEEPVIISEVV